MNRQVRIIGVPMDLGADRRGVDMGSSTIRYAGLADELDALGYDVIDAGDLPVPRAEERDPEAEQPTEGSAKFLRETSEVCTTLADEVADALDSGQFPLVLGGDHSIAIGTVTGAARDADIGVVWFDAHGDFNTPTTSPSGNVHGMPLAALLGIGDFADTEWANAPTLSEENVAMVGLRRLDDAEREAIRESDVTAYTMSDIDERGVVPVVEDALDVATYGISASEARGGSSDVSGGDPVRRELRNAAVVRELHVYGSQVGVGKDAGADGPVDEHQHQGYGKRLLAEAERIAADAGYDKLAVLSGIGVREYYREKLAFKQDGPYVSKRL